MTEISTAGEGDPGSKDGAESDVDQSAADGMRFDAATADEQENLPGQGSA